MSSLYEIPSSVIVVCLFGVLMLMADIGFRFGRRTRAKLTEYDGANLRTLQSSLLWLMGLLLAFAFSMAAARHKANQEMVFREATLLHAILMDARMLPAPQRDRLHQLLKQYADARLEFFFAGRDLPHVYAALDRTAQLHTEMVDLIQAEALRVPPPPGAQATLGRLNEEWGVLRERTGVFENRVPDEVFFLLFVACCLGMALIGFGFGMAQRREILGGVLFGVLLRSTIYVVLDLDRPRRGLIDVSQAPMLGFKEALQSGCRATPETQALAACQTYEGRWVLSLARICGIRTSCRRQHPVSLSRSLREAATNLHQAFQDLRRPHWHRLAGRKLAIEHCVIPCTCRSDVLALHSVTRLHSRRAYCELRDGKIRAV